MTIRRFRLVVVVDDAEASSEQTLKETEQAYREIIEDAGFDLTVVEIDVQEIEKPAS